jgi:hypothetical protein
MSSNRLNQWNKRNKWDRFPKKNHGKSSRVHPRSPSAGAFSPWIHPLASDKENEKRTAGNGECGAIDGQMYVIDITKQLREWIESGCGLEHEFCISIYWEESSQLTFIFFRGIESRIEWSRYEW